MRTYKQLEMVYSDTLKCSCSKTTILYNKFTLLSVRLHQVCSSDFVSDRWISQLKSSMLLNNNNDWRQKAHSEFNLLSNLCELAKMTVDNSVNEFLSKSFVTSNMISEINFLNQLDGIFSQFTNSIKINFNILLDTISLTIDVDQPLKGFIVDIESDFQMDLIWKGSFDENLNQVEILFDLLRFLFDQLKILD